MARASVFDLMGLSTTWEIVNPEMEHKFEGKVATHKRNIVIDIAESGAFDCDGLWGRENVYLLIL